LRVVEAVTSVAESAGEFAAHLFPDESPEVDSSVDLLVALRLAAVVAWMDAVGIWVVSAAAIPLAPSISEHVAPPPGHRAPATLVEEVVAAMPDRYTIEEYRAVLEQLEAQWDELAVLDDEGPPDFNEDWQGVVDVDGFALREERSL
jgi:hypothetical protein